MRVLRGWQAATGDESTDVLYWVSDSGVRCITAPCFSYQAVVVNGAGETAVSDIDLSNVGASFEQLAGAQSALAGSGLLVAGAIEPEPDAGPAGEGLVFVASQFYLEFAPN